jgi:hypothetical protein
MKNKGPSPVSSVLGRRRRRACADAAAERVHVLSHGGNAPTLPRASRRRHPFPTDAMRVQARSAAPPCVTSRGSCHPPPPPRSAMAKAFGYR